MLKTISFVGDLDRLTNRCKNIATRLFWSRIATSVVCVKAQGWGQRRQPCFELGNVSLVRRYAHRIRHIYVLQYAAFDDSNSSKIGLDEMCRHSNV
jgi:hypothetical protein